MAEQPDPCNICEKPSEVKLFPTQELIKSLAPEDREAFLDNNRQGRKFCSPCGGDAEARGWWSEKRNEAL